MTAARQGYVQIYTGDGKGKTTAALGLIVRALGQGLRPAVLQFMKSDPSWGEVVTLKKLGVPVEQCGLNHWVIKGEASEEDLALDHPVVQPALLDRHAELLEGPDLAPAGIGLHELQDGRPQALTEGADDEPQSGRRLALAVPGVDLHVPLARGGHRFTSRRVTSRRRGRRRAASAHSRDPPCQAREPLVPPASRR